MAKRYVGNYGFDIILDIGLDVTDATGLSFTVEKPGGTNVTWAPITVFETNNLRYVVESGDLDEAGVYRIQPNLSIATDDGTTVVGPADPYIMKVNPAITV